jgi:hypothetical protein
LIPSRREGVERTTLRIVGWCFVALAIYIVYESAFTLIRRQSPEGSIPGIIIAAAAVNRDAVAGENKMPRTQSAVKW